MGGKLSRGAGGSWLPEAALPVEARRGRLLILIAFQGEGWDPDIKMGAVRPLKAKRAPHVPAGRLQGDVAAVLEGWLFFGQDGLSPHDSPATDSLQGTRQAEYPPMPFPELHHFIVQVFQADAVAPPVDVRILSFPHAHVEGDDCDSDVFSGLPVHIGELQPRVVFFPAKHTAYPWPQREELLSDHT